LGQGRFGHPSTGTLSPIAKKGAACFASPPIPLANDRASSGLARKRRISGSNPFGWQEKSDCDRGDGQDAQPHEERVIQRRVLISDWPQPQGI
jgi:hypothetical protein